MAKIVLRAGSLGLATGDGGGGGGSTLGEKTISTYGVYNASADNLDGYSKVTNVTGLETATASGGVASISDAVAMPCPSVVANIDYTAQGVTGATCSRFSVNLCDEDFEKGTLNNTTGLPENDNYNVRMKNYVPIVGGIQVYLYFGLNVNLRYYWYDKDKTFISGSTGRNTILTVPENACYFKIRTTNNYGATYNNDISLNYPSTDTSYHAYDGTTYTADFERTIYGGNYDFVSGVLTEDTDSNGDPISPPNVYNLTPQTITTAQGVNNFYADTGDTSVTYYREKTGDSYLYNVNTVIFNTGYVHKANTKLVLDCEPWQGGGAYAVLCGARAGNYANNAMLFFGKYNGLCYGWSRTGQEEVSGYWTDSSNYAWYYTRCIITMQGKTCDILNVDTRETRTITCENATENDGIAPIALFCDNNSSSADGFAAQDWSMMKFYSLKIYEGDVLVHNFVPAYDNDQYCIYDTIDQVYKYDLQASGAYLRGYIVS